MIFDRSEQNPGARLLFILACLVIVVYGLKYASPILLPSSLAVFLAVLSLPVMIFLQHRRVPAPLAIGITVLLIVSLFALVLLLASQSLSDLQAQLPRYAVRLSDLQAQWIRAIESRLGLPVGEYVTTELIDPGAVVDFVGSAVGRIAQIVSTTFLVFLITIFMLAEATVIPAKLHHVFGQEGSNEDRLAKVVTEIQTYLGIKTVISVATGLLLGAFTYVMGLDFPILLGLVAFLLNYIPTVGSIIAAVPAVLLSLILHGSIGHALAVSGGYVAVNTLFGNILEPNLMGRRLGLSTLVVILSLLFWGWAWGPLGALLSVPLTVIVKIWLENTHDLRWVAILLDKEPPGPALASVIPDDVSSV